MINTHAIYNQRIKIITTMKRWDINQMLATSRQLFAKVMKRKRLAHHNHDIHFLAREVDNWHGNRTGIPFSRSPLREKVARRAG